MQKKEEEEERQGGGGRGKERGEISIQFSSQHYNKEFYSQAFS